MGLRVAVSEARRLVPDQLGGAARLRETQPSRALRQAVEQIDQQRRILAVERTRGDGATRFGRHNKLAVRKRGWRPQALILHRTHHRSLVVTPDKKPTGWYFFTNRGFCQYAASMKRMRYNAATQTRF